jgi:molybdopterin-containing oxidoreductase family iron-sulfur binding subunit
MMDRRRFLKLTGATALAGMVTKLSALVGFPSETSASSEARDGNDAGKQLAMVIDLGKCLKAKGCTDCIKACHRTHNVPEIANPKHDVKWIWKESFGHVFHGQVHEFEQEKYRHALTPVLCNHCENPACVKVCPTKATWKRAEDGVVMMDWHRCIGCRYCIAACPYGARSFNFKDPRPFLKKIRDDFPTRTKGVVEKCTFCEERLARGQRPACLEACKAGAISFGNINDPKSKVRKILGARFSLTRKPGLGTGPQIYYTVG